MKDYITQMGGAALGARLRRLSQAIDSDASRVYAACGIRFEQRWFGIINQLALAGPLSVRELSHRLGITHASVSETRKSLEQAGLIMSKADIADARRRLLALSPSGNALAIQLRPLWDAFDDAARELDVEADVISALARLEQSLDRKSLYERIADHGSPVRIRRPNSGPI